MKWREIGPYFRELWQRPAGPMNWKNPIRVFAVAGWLVMRAAGKIVLRAYPNPPSRGPIVARHISGRCPQ